MGWIKRLPVSTVLTGGFLIVAAMGVAIGRVGHLYDYAVDPRQ